MKYSIMIKYKFIILFLFTISFGYGQDDGAKPDSVLQVNPTNMIESPPNSPDSVTTSVSNIMSLTKDSLSTQNVVATDILKSDSSRAVPLSQASIDSTSLIESPKSKSYSPKLNKRTQEDLAKLQKFIQSHKKQVYGSLGVAIPVAYYYATKKEPIFVKGIGYPPDWPE